MKILKKILLVIVILIGLVLITGLFVNKDMKAEREVIIDKPRAQVFDYVKHLRNQSDYSKWGGMDPNMKKEYKGVDGTVGFIFKWESDKDDVGKGEQEIKGIKENERIDYELRFIEPWESTATSAMILEEIPGDANKTKVKWGFSGSMDYPFNVMRLFMDMEKMIGDDFATGLNNLKTKMERQ